MELIVSFTFHILSALHFAYVLIVIQEMDRNDAQAMEIRKQQREKSNNDLKPKISRNAPKAPRNSKKTINAETVTESMDTTSSSTTEVGKFFIPPSSETPLFVWFYFLCILVLTSMIFTSQQIIRW